MSNSLKERIINASFAGILFFMILSINYKLINYREDWLSYCTMWAISWAIGCFLSKTIALIDTNSMGTILLLEALIIFLVTVVMAFILGVIIEFQRWEDILYDTCIPFGASLFIYNKWKRN